VNRAQAAWIALFIFSSTSSFVWDVKVRLRCGVITWLWVNEKLRVFVPARRR
jgi:hypothetical protein